MSAPDAVSARNIVLVGLRGAGKTSVGQALADRLQWTFVDTDALVTAAAGTSIRAIFEQRGEAAFRGLEQAAVEAATEGSRQVISVGGGAVLRPENRARLRQAGPVVWLTAALDTLERRIAADPASAATRPVLTPDNRRDELECLLAARRPLYAELASLTIDTTDRTVTEVVDAIWSRLR